MPARCAGCTRSCSTGRCSTRWHTFRPSTLRLTTAEAGRRLAALGFADPRGALHHIGALTRGLSRRAAIQRALLPVMLSYFSEAPEPDAGLRAYRRVSDALGATPWYLRLLRDEGAVAARLASVLGTSRYVSEMLVRAPEALALLADDDALVPRPADELHTAMVEAALRQPDDTAAVAVVRGLRRRELLRIAFADLLGRLDVTEVGEAISATTEATLDATLQVTRRSVAAELGRTELPIEFAVIAMGRLGGCEVGYGSDADVVFVFEPRDPRLPERSRCSDCPRHRRADAQAAQRPIQRPAARRRRESAPGGAQRSPRAFAAVLRALLRAMVFGVGSTGTAAGTILRGRRGARRALRPADRSGALPAERHRRRGSGGDPPAEGTRRQRAAATRRGLIHPPQTRPRRAG